MENQRNAIFKKPLALLLTLMLIMGAFLQAAFAANETLILSEYPPLLAAAGQEFNVEYRADADTSSISGIDVTLHWSGPSSGSAVATTDFYAGYVLPKAVFTVAFSSVGSYTLYATATINSVPCTSISKTVNVLDRTTPAPAANIDYGNERLTGLTANTKYLIQVDGPGGGIGKFPSDASGNLSLYDAWMNGVNNNFHICVAGDASTTVDGIILDMTIPARPAAPAVTAINAATAGGTGGIGGTTTAMEYSDSATGPWTDCGAGSTTNLAQGTYYVRTKAVANTSFASEQATVTIADATDKDITAFSINGVNGTISGTAITVNMPYGTNKANLTPTITHTGASVSPDTGVAQDFTNPVTYTVTAADGSTQGFVVTVNVSANNNSDSGGSWQGPVILTDGLPAGGRVPVGGRFTLTPSVSPLIDGGWKWEYDQSAFDATFNSPATFTAKKAGVYTITLRFTGGGYSLTQDYTVTVGGGSPNPQTGRDGLNAPGSGNSLAAAALMAAAVIWAGKRRGARART